MIPRTPLFSSILWGLFSLWMFFGCLELAEQLHIVSEAAAEDQEHQHVAADALVQLASGLKSDVASLEAPCCTSGAAEIAESAYSSSVNIVPPLEQPLLYGPPSLRRHQQLAVYRI